MAERRVVRQVGRPQYGRPAPPPKRRGPSVGKSTGGAVKSLPWRLISLVGGTLVLLWIVWSIFTIYNVNVTTPTEADNVKSEVQTLLGKSMTQDNLLTLDTGKLAANLITLGSLPSGSTLPVVVDGSNLPVQKGQQVVTANFVTFCNDLLANLPSTGLSATGLRVQDTTFDLYVKTNKGYQLIFDTTRPAADEIADLKTVLHTLAGKAPTQYIDMRISGKAYYQ
jgi:cell division septal protein FtsQ